MTKLTAICRPKQWPTISSDSFSTGGYPVYGANGRIGFYREFNHRRPTVLITCRGATCGTINISEPCSYVTGNAMALDNLDERVDLGFLAYFLRTRGLRDAITGSAQPQITRESLSKLEIPIPKLEEQRRIAAILDQAEALRAKRRQALAKLDTLTQSLFLEMFGDPSRNPLKWPVVQIGDLAESCSYGSSSKAGSEGAYPMLRMNNLTADGRMDFTDLKFIDLPQGEEERWLVRTGDVLFNRTNSAELVGKTAVFRAREPMVYAGYLIRIRVNRRATPAYVATFLNSRYGKATLRAMCKSIIGMANINATELQTIRIPAPPALLQEDFEQKAIAIQDQREKVMAECGVLDSLASSLQHRAFRGEL